MTLIERLEAAEAGSRELDGAIARTLGLEVQFVTLGPDHRREELSWIERSAPDRAPISRPVPRYTTSLDAAMTLYVIIPERVPSNPRQAAIEALRQRINHD